MRLYSQLRRLRTKHGPGAIDAYHALREALQKIAPPTALKIDEVFERHGVLATAAAFRLHVQRIRDMSDLVHEERPGRRAATVRRSPKRK